MQNNSFIEFPVTKTVVTQKPIKFDHFLSRASFSNKNLVEGTCNKVSLHCLLSAHDIIKIVVNVSYNLFHTLASFSFKGLRMSNH